MDFHSENPIKKRKCKDEDEPEQHQLTNGMDSLPNEISMDILSRLPITSIMSFRFVCRSWYVMSRDPDLVNLHLYRTGNKSPYLIFHCDYPIRNLLYFVEFSEEKGVVRKIQTPFCCSMPEFNVVGSCNGLLCVSDSLYNNSVCVYNPFTRNYKELPETRQFQEQVVLFGFGFNHRNEYKVVKMVYYRNAYNGRARRFRIRDYPQSEVLIFSLNSNSWRSIGNVPYAIDKQSCEAVFVSGRLHWITRLGRYKGVRGRLMISFDLDDEKFKEVPKPDCGGLKKGNYQLAVLGGCLSAVVYCNNGKLEIWVMKEYGVKESWIKEFTVGAYSPKFMSQDFRRSYGIWKNALSGRIVKVLCLRKNGEILLEYKCGTLTLYDPESRKFRSLVFEGMPNLFRTVVHVGSLNWIDVPIEM